MSVYYFIQKAKEISPNKCDEEHINENKFYKK